MKIDRIVGRRIRNEYRILRWDIIQACNYKCDYCIKDVYYRKKQTVPYIDCIKWINTNLINLDKPFIVQLFGGEPTIHSNFWDICNLLKVPFGIYTNLSQSLDFYKKLFEIENFIYFICSLHYSQEKDIKIFISKIEYLLNYNVFFNIAIFLENKNLQEIEETFIILRDLVRNKGKVYFNNETTNMYYYKNINLSYFNKYMLPEQFIEIYSKNGMQIISELDATILKFNNNLNIKGFICNCNEYGNFVLDIDGNIFNCVSNPPISNIYINDFQIKCKNIICKSPQCQPYLLEYGDKKRF